MNARVNQGTQHGAQQHQTTRRDLHLPHDGQRCALIFRNLHTGGTQRTNPAFYQQDAAPRRGGGKRARILRRAAARLAMEDHCGPRRNAKRRTPQPRHRRMGRTRHMRARPFIGVANIHQHGLTGGDQASGLTGRNGLGIHGWAPACRTWLK